MHICIDCPLRAKKQVLDLICLSRGKSLHLHALFPFINILPFLFLVIERFLNPQLHSHSIMASTLSQPVDPSAIAASGCFTSLPLRKSNYEGIAVAASFDLFEEYNRLVREADVTKGVYDPRGHGVSFWYPECLPERIDLVTRMQDLGLIHDGETISYCLVGESLYFRRYWSRWHPC